VIKMRPRSYATLRLLAVLVTICIIMIHQHLLPRTLQIYPDPSEVRFSWIFGPSPEGSGPYGWLDTETNHFWCNYAPGDPFSCGWSLNLGHDRIHGIDFSEYDGFNFFIRYKGNAPRVRLFLRDFDPAYTDVEKFDTASKVMSTTVRTSTLNQPVYVHLSEFSVAEWWITEFDISGPDSAPSVSNTITIGVDFNVHSENDVQIERIEAVGQWLKTETLYFGIISFWMVLIVLEVLWRFYMVHKKAKADALRLDSLVSEYKKLEVEKQEFEALSTTDPLTGVMNRAGVQQFLQRLFDSDFSRNQMGVLFFDIDHFKKINDQLGHDVGDIVLSTFASIINDNIRHTDIFGRWGGEEFILVCSQIHEERLRALADKLRETVAQHEINADGKTIKVTVSIGVTTVAANENFEAVFKRADVALYKAKNSGRNQVQFERA
jgi:diguanylate cyclase (GGDEF)-like protein